MCVSRPADRSSSRPSERASESGLGSIEVGHDPFAAHAALAVYAPSWLSFARIPRRVGPVVDAQALAGLSGSTYKETIRVKFREAKIGALTGVASDVGDARYE